MQLLENTWYFERWEIKCSQKRNTTCEKWAKISISEKSLSKTSFYSLRYSHGGRGKSPAGQNLHHSYLIKMPLAPKAQLCYHKITNCLQSTFVWENSQSLIFKVPFETQLNLYHDHLILFPLSHSKRVSNSKCSRNYFLRSEKNTDTLLHTRNAVYWFYNKICLCVFLFICLSLSLSLVVHQFCLSMWLELRLRWN